MKAIDTYHNGRLFRSRLEARWAVFFEALGVRYDYEPEGFRFDDGTMYLPDFWLPEQECWVEIKAVEAGHVERRKAGLLAQQSGYTVYVFDDGLSLPDDGYPEAPFAHAVFGDGVDWPYLWCECPDCGKLGVQFDGRADRLPCKECYICAGGHDGFGDTPHEPTPECSGCPRHGGNLDKGYNHDSPRLVAAYQAALSARFEHDAREVPGFETVGSVVENLKRGARIGGAVRRGEAIRDATPRQEGDQTA